jgi:hypothetical protein
VQLSDKALCLILRRAHEIGTAAPAPASLTVNTGPMVTAPSFGKHAGMVGGVHDTPMSPTRADYLPKMETKRPDSGTLSKKLDMLKDAQGPLQLALGERVRQHANFAPPAAA